MAFLNDAYKLPHEGDIVDYVEVEYGHFNTATIHFTNGKTVIVHTYRPDLEEERTVNAQGSSEEKGENNA